MSGVLVEVIVPIFEVLDVSMGHNTSAFKSRYLPLGRSKTEVRFKIVGDPRNRSNRVASRGLGMIILR
jgi:hypothetical protein